MIVVELVKTVWLYKVYIPALCVCMFLHGLCMLLPWLCWTWANSTSALGDS